mgnify:CR=1 FL=1
MKKIIEIEINNDNYILLHSGKKIIEISKDNLTMKGKDLYDNFFSKLDLEDNIEIEYLIKSECKNPTEERIVDDIKEILDGIVTKINFKINSKKSDKKTK